MLRMSDAALLGRYDAFFRRRRRLQIVDVSAAVIERATDLRARYRFKTPDAIHLATPMSFSPGVPISSAARKRRSRSCTREGTGASVRQHRPLLDSGRRTARARCGERISHAP
jgi:hypothetical protein